MLDACVRDGALRQVGQGRKATWQIDKAKLRATLAARRDQLFPAVRDCLVVACAQTDANLQPVFVALLEAFGREKKDERALGFAAFFTAWAAKRSEPVEAEEAYRGAIEHFGAASEPAWQVFSLNELGVLLLARSNYAGAEPVLRDAMVMCQKLYPKDKYPQGHHEVASSLISLGKLLRNRGDSAGAEPLFREALAMCRKLYHKDTNPKGHPYLAFSLNELGELLCARGDHAGGEPLLREALAKFGDPSRVELLASVRIVTARVGAATR